MVLNRTIMRHERIRGIQAFQTAYMRIERETAAVYYEDFSAAVTGQSFRSQQMLAPARFSLRVLHTVSYGFPGMLFCL